LEEFEASYGPRHPVFYRGPYSASLAEAKKDLKFLLVYLHSPVHQDTEEFCREILTHSEVVSYITRNNILFWSSSVELPEGHRASLALREHTYPFLGLIVLQDNRMVIVRRWEGLSQIHSVERLLSTLQQAIEDNEASLTAARAEREERNMNQIIRQQQDEDYQQSLEQDRKKELQKQEEKKKRDEAEKLKRQKEDQEKDKRNRLIALKKVSGDKLDPEPDSNDDPDVVRILIKLPDGTRLERRFYRQTSIKYLYLFVFSHEKSPMIFQITTNFPRKELPCQSPSLDNPDCKVKNGDDEIDPPTFAQVGLGKSEVLFVHDLEA
jgi:FAS-associated factor 2